MASTNNVVSSSVGGSVRPQQQPAAAAANYQGPRVFIRNSKLLSYLARQMPERNILARETFTVNEVSMTKNQFLLWYF
jgi:hypothetical protein